MIRYCNLDAIEPNIFVLWISFASNPYPLVFVVCYVIRYGNLDASVVSYGPCQTPTLNFTVERHQQIVAFQPEPYWVVKPSITKVRSRF
jgi:hypothetical protein